MKSTKFYIRVSLLVVLAASVTMVLAGCASKGPKRVPAVGAVTLDGQPVNTGILYLNPDGSRGNDSKISCESPVRNGKFNIRTRAIVASESGSGAPPGWYKVTLRCNLPGVPPVFPGQPELDIDPKYLDAAKTPLSVEVPDNPEGASLNIILTKQSTEGQSGSAHK